MAQATLAASDKLLLAVIVQVHASSSTGSGRQTGKERRRTRPPPTEPGLFCAAGSTTPMRGRGSPFPPGNRQEISQKRAAAVLFPLGSRHCGAFPVRQKAYSAVALPHAWPVPLEGAFPRRFPGPHPATAVRAASSPVAAHSAHVHGSSCPSHRSGAAPPQGRRR